MNSQPSAPQALIPRPGFQPPALPHRPSGPGRVADDPEPGLTLAFIGRALQMWWKVALPAALLLAAISVPVVFYLFPPAYRATAWIQIEENAPYVVQPTRDESKRFVQTQIELLRSPLVLAPVLSRPQVAQLKQLQEEDDPLKYLAGELRVLPVGNSELFQVSFESPRASDAALIVNEVVDAYFRMRAQASAERMQRVIELLEQEQDRRGSYVQQLRQQLRDLGKDVVGADALSRQPLSDVVVVNNPLQAIRDRLTASEVERRVLEAEVTALEESLEQDRVEVSEALVETEVERLPQIQGMIALLAQKREHLHTVELNSAVGRDDPAYRRLSHEIEHYENALAQVKEAARPRVRERLRAITSLQREDELAQARTKLQGQLALEDLLRQRYQQQLDDVTRKGDRTLEFEFVRSELAREEAVFEQIAERALTLRTEMRAPARVTLLKQAEVPTAPVQRLPYALAVALAGSLCLPFGLAIARERMVQRISDASELEATAPVGVVGEITELPASARRSRRGASLQSIRALDLYEESIDNLRTCVILPDESSPIRVIAVASAVPREGKTSVSSQLAVSIARSTGGPVLLIDGDLRSPDIHNVFQIPAEPGLCQVLDGTCEWEDAVYRGWSDSLHILPAGSLHKNPHSLLGSGLLHAMLKELRDEYRYIVLDTPPLLAASEALVMAKSCDGTILCARRGYSRLRQIRLAYRRLITTGANPIGTVLSAVPRRNYAYTYGSYAYARPVGS